MLTVITEHTNLIRGKSQVAAHPHLQYVPAIIEAVNRALGDTGAQLRAAIDALPDVAERRRADSALQALQQQAARGAHLDAVLAAAALLPADLDVDYDTARLRAERESTAVDLTRSTAILARALEGARADRGAQLRSEGPRCPECGTIAPGHSTVHQRHPEGGGGVNRPCSRAGAAGADA